MLQAESSSTVGQEDAESGFSWPCTRPLQFEGLTYFFGAVPLIGGHRQHSVQVAVLATSHSTAFWQANAFGRL